MSQSPEFPTNPSSRATAAELADFVFHSFYFSQGSGDLQKELLHYGRSYYQQDLVAQPQLYAETRELVEKRSSVWVKGTHTHDDVSSDIVSRQTTEQVDTLFEIAHGVRPRTITSQVDNNIALGTVARDYRWLLTDDANRPNRDPGNTNEYNDPFLSFAMHYGILGNTTRRPVYDLIFQRVGRAMLTLYENNDPRRIPTGVNEWGAYPDALQSVADVHCQYHPEQASRIRATLQAHAPRT